MTISKTQIANLALIEIGESTLNAFDDDKPSAEVIRVLYEPTRDWVLRDYPWNFAMVRVNITSTGTPPAWSANDRNSDNQDLVYTLPTDCLKAVLVNGAHPRADLWRVEGQSIVSNMSAPLELLYISRVEDEALFDASFIRAFSKRLAAELAIRITEDKERKQQIEQEYRQVIADARSADGQEGTSRIVAATSWDEARYTNYIGAFGNVWIRR